MTKVATALLALLIASHTGAASARTPFLPKASTGDAVVEKRVWLMNNPTPLAITVYHHAEWVRIDQPQTHDITTIYFNKEKRIQAGLRRNASGYQHLSFQLDRCEYNCGSDQPAFNTGERQTYLGETCMVWSIIKFSSSEVSACVTDDGIELWNQHVTDDGKSLARTEATSITRRAVRLEEVQPPKDMLSIAKWSDDPALFKDAAAEFDGYEAILEDPHTPENRKIFRKSGEWTMREEFRSNRYDSASFLYRDRELSISFTNRNGKRYLMSITRSLGPGVPNAAFDPKPLGKKEQVFGETCEWIDRKPYMSDAGEHACETSDGIALILTFTNRGFHKNTKLEATKFRRGKIRLADALPPPDLFEFKTWGWPE